jgi:hypothetical protein
VIDDDKEEAFACEKEETLDVKKERTPKEKMTTKMTNLLQEFRENHALLGDLLMIMQRRFTGN